MVKYGLLIGINYRNTNDELYGCINDVNNVKIFLESKLGYTNFLMLTDDTPLKPTKKNILKAIESLVLKLKSGDEAWFHYSGHGVLIYDRNGDEESGQDSCLAPLDFQRTGFINDDTLRSILVQKVPKGAKLYLVLDACHSGTGCDLRYKYDDSSYVTNENVKSPVYIPSEWSLCQTSYEFKKYPRISGEVYCLSGCQDEQESADAFIESDQMYGGMMTSTMLSFFRSNDLQTYKWKHLLKDISCCIKVNEHAQVVTLTSGNPLNMEDSVFSSSFRNPVKPPSSKKNKYKKKFIQIANMKTNANANIVYKTNNNQMKKMIFM
jgi:hypothetical protein